ncbi:DNA polymerase III subunit chi [Jannaschia pohangensis]|uniref:DNA polymerase III, chi subunit n=1 Tax=Jannaschia pohangensis TaxID=390807 RepID=A0A1I3S7G6_9RHOB|nr:DNA polymerase III subunit chi [Jannaschia pohangensis]SFJ54628.1 DNA polymerase III, chi subunit [Jannaschia pohangensis]
MGEAYFYHLTRNPVDATLSNLLTRSLAQGWRVAVRGSDQERLRWLDEKLWQGPKEGFLPHGLAGGDHDARQPILLTTGPAANDPQCLMAVDGASVEADEVSAMARVCILFDGLDPEALAQARTQWKSLTDAGCGARYWSEESGKWEEKATKNV